MSLVDEIQKIIEDAMETDPGRLEAMFSERGADDVPDPMFLNSVARSCAALLDCVKLVAAEVDALRASIEQRENPADTG